MKKIAEMSPEEIAAYCLRNIASAGVTVTLTGRAAAIWSDGKYVSDDWIEEGPGLSAHARECPSAFISLVIDRLVFSTKRPAGRMT